MPKAEIARCANCSEVLAEPPNIPVTKRRACPNCGGFTRNYEVELSASVTPSGEVVVEVRPAGAREGAPSLTIRVSDLEDAGYDLQWLRLTPGGAWMLRVFDRGGTFIDGAVADKPEDALLALAERLLP